MDFYEVSSKTHTNVDCIFNSLAIKIMNSNLHQNFRPQEASKTTIKFCHYLVFMKLNDL